VPRDSSSRHLRDADAVRAGLFQFRARSPGGERYAYDITCTVLADVQLKKRRTRLGGIDGIPSTVDWVPRAKPLADDWRGGLAHHFADAPCCVPLCVVLSEPFSGTSPNSVHQTSFQKHSPPGNMALHRQNQRIACARKEARDCKKLSFLNPETKIKPERLNWSSDQLDWRA